MCYAIPGKIIKINNNLVTLEYFGEQRKARNEFFSLTAGEYAYAQGGFIIQKISAQEALPILDSWEELFFKLKKVDLRLSQKTNNLSARANNLRFKYHGNSCCVHGIIEFSNYCRNDCLYCGIRKSNNRLKRYRMNINEIIEAAEAAVKNFGFKALVLQSGEDAWYDEERLVCIVEGIQKSSPCLITLSIGERESGIYERLYRVGARGVLLRFETSSASLYARMKPSHLLKDRLDLIKKLRNQGYLLMSGFLIGLPGSSQEDTTRDLELTGSLDVEMFSFGPFIPHPQTPLANSKVVALDEVLALMAGARIMFPQAKILVTTAMETLDKSKALKLGLISGANSMMINLTPGKYRRLYEVYPQRAGIDTTVELRIESVIKLLHSLGRAPTDLGL